MNRTSNVIMKMIGHGAGFRRNLVIRASRSLRRYPIFCFLLAMVCQPAYSEAKIETTKDSAGWEFSSTHGLSMRSPSGNLEFSLGGRLHADTALFNDDLTPIENDSLLRRARLDLVVRLGDRWRLKAETENAPGREGLRNLWVRYRPKKGVSIKAGNFVAPFGLEDIGTSNHSVFMERSISAALAPSFQTGVGVGLHGLIGDVAAAHSYTLSFSVGRPPLGNSQDDFHKSEHTSVTSRFTLASISRSDHVLHAGIAVHHRNISKDSRYRIRSRTESSLGPALFNTRSLVDIDSVTTVGVEAATVLGAFAAQGEYMHANLQRRDGQRDPQFDGWYTQVSYAITGEHRRYSRSSATFRGLRPDNLWGAIELAFRISHLDLDDASVFGGEASNRSFGVNWYVRENLKLMINYIDVDAKRRNDLRSDDPQILQARVLVFF